MHSRAYLLLRRDLINLQRFPLKGVAALPTDNDSLFHWNAKIEGLGGTPWEGGIFQVTLSFNETFNTRPPEIHFLTIPFHPNVDPQSGTPSCHLLGEGWSEDCTVASVLMALQALLDSPELDGGCTQNKDAARLLQEAPHTYRQMALDCVTASLRIDAGLPPYDENEEVSPEESFEKKPPSATDRPRSKHRRHRAPKPVSFDDYHALWKGIATSLTSYQQPNSFVRLLERDKQLQSVHFGSGGLEGYQKNFEKKLKEHALLRYGDAKPAKLQPRLEPQGRAKRVEQLKKMYREATMAEHEAPPSSPTRECGGEEADELVQWSRGLNEQDLVDST